MRFKKIYIEITNSCNFHCSFCFKSNRPNKYITVAEFQTVLTKIRPYTDYIYLHVLGEPLNHPQIAEILGAAALMNLKVNITTNGSLLTKHASLLQSNSVRQINISLHDAEENIAVSRWSDFLIAILDFACQAAPSIYINLRLWNNGSENSTPFNTLCFQLISQRFGIAIELLTDLSSGKSIKLSEHIFIQAAPRFEWPNINGKQIYTSKTCHALKDHIAILSDGTVVPCCIDGDANLKLGNIFTQELSEILITERALKLKKGFEESKVTEPFCATCGFRTF